jgi:hypothetical protein
MGNEDEGLIDDDEDTDMSETQDFGGRPIVRHVVKDLATAVKMKRVQAQADAAARRAEAKARQMEAKLELAKMKISMNAREAASKHLATFAGLYMTLMVMSFLVSVKYLDAEMVAVVAGLITLVVTSISALLRSIVVEAPENGHDAKGPKEPSDSTD